MASGPDQFEKTEGGGGRVWSRFLDTFKLPNARGNPFDFPLVNRIKWKDIVAFLVGTALVVVTAGDQTTAIAAEYDAGGVVSTHGSVADAETAPLEGEYTLDEFSSALDPIELFPGTEPEQSVYRNYRRWGLESAALDLALKQAETTLADALDALLGE
jgi:hypothetical protein